MPPLVPYVRSPQWGPNDALLHALRGALPEAEVVARDEVPAERVGDVRVAIVDGPDADQLTSLPDLQWVQSTWAGVETLLDQLPPHVAIARMIDPQLTASMTEAVVAWTLYLHRDMPRYARQQRAHTWQEHPLVRACDRRVTVLGLGELGAAAARALADHGFAVAGWSRSPKTLPGIETAAGPDGLVAVLERSDIVVNLLPRTPDTDGLLGAAAFARMPAGASIINFGRGQTIDDDALLAALDDGPLDHAVLDVFDIEPLPADHPFWGHDSVTVLPHISGPTSIDTAAVIAADNVRRYLATGDLPADALVERNRGY